MSGGDQSQGGFYGTMIAQPNQGQGQQQQPSDPLGQLRNLLGGGQQQQPRLGEPFLPYTQGRGASDWGQPDWILNGARGYPGVSPGPLMPQIADVLGIYQRNVFALGRFGNPLVGQNALQAMIFRGNFEKAYQAGLMQQAKLHKELADQHEEEMIRQQVHDSETYGQIFSAYGAGGDKNLSDKPGGGGRLEQDLRNYALRTNNHWMQVALDTRGVKGAWDLNEHNDHNLLPIMKVGAQRDAERRAAAQEERAQHADVRAEEKSREEKELFPTRKSELEARTAKERAEAAAKGAGVFETPDEPAAGAGATNVGGRIDPVTGKTQEQEQTAKPAEDTGAGGTAGVGARPSEPAADESSDKSQPAAGAPAITAGADSGLDTKSGAQAPTAPAGPAPAGAPTTTGQATREPPTTGDVTSAKDVGETGAQPPAAKPPAAAAAAAAAPAPATAPATTAGQVIPGQVNYPAWSANPANPRAGQPPRPEIGAEGMRLLMGGTPNKDTPAAAVTYANERHNAAASILGSNLRAQAAVDWLKQNVGGEFAARARAQAYAEVPPAVGQYGGGGAHPLPGLLDSVAKQINPNYTDQNYKWTTDLQNPSSNQGKRFQQDAKLAAAGKQVLMDLANMPRERLQSLPAGWLWGAAEKISGDPEIAGLRRDLGLFAEIATGLSRSSGQAEHDILRALPGLGESPAQITTTISKEMNNSTTGFNDLQDQMQKITGSRDIRLLPPQTPHETDWISRINPYTGKPDEDRAEPGDVAVQWKNPKTGQAETIHVPPGLVVNYRDPVTGKTEQHVLGEVGTMPLQGSKEYEKRERQGQAQQAAGQRSPEQRASAIAKLQGMSRQQKDARIEWAKKNMDDPDYDIYAEAFGLERKK